MFPIFPFYPIGFQTNLFYFGQAASSLLRALILEKSITRSTLLYARTRVFPSVVDIQDDKANMNCYFLPVAHLDYILLQAQYYYE